MSESDEPSAELARTNALLAEWAARSAAESEALVERLERMGYAVRGKSEDEAVEILKQPPGSLPSHSDERDAPGEAHVKP